MQPDILAEWPLVSRLLDEALALDDAARTAWLESLPSEHARLRPTLERLLARRDEAAGFFDRPAAEGGEDETLEITEELLIGAEFGPYRLERLLGRGGMGTVWLARRTDGGLDLPVAIKLPVLDSAGGPIGERLERERQILAALNHPNIARLYEAGVSASGRPFLALEYIEGETLLNYCELHGLTARRRIELFLQVLRAVHYAHTSLVIHRDIKPSNIIVTPAGEVKLLDFGIAKLLDRQTRSTERTELTQVYGRMMTLTYASPEQVLGEPLTTATDVYSLGVILFELLTGTRPYRLKRGTAAELEEAILTGASVRPSNAVTATFARSASMSLGRWRRVLRGDLDTIIVKALERDPARRYPSVDALAQDCERYLQGQPVLAQPHRPLYRLAKFVGRHRLALGAATAVLAALVVGLGIALWQARVAQEEARKQAAVQSFLTSLFEKNTRLQPDAAQARTMTVRELLLDAGDRVEHAFDDTPALKLELLNTVARLLREIDEYERSAVLAREAVAVARDNGFTRDDAYVEALLNLTTVARLLGSGPEAVKARDEALAVLEARGDRTSLLRARADVTTVAQMAPDAAREIEIVQHGAELFEQRYPQDPSRFNALWVLGNLYRTQQQPLAAAENFRRAIAAFGQVGSRDYTNYAASHGFLAQCEFGLGHVKTATDLYARGLELLDRHAGPTALVTRFHRGNYALMLHVAGRPEEAHRLFAEVRASQPAEGPTVVDFDNAVYQAGGYLAEGRAREAQEVLEPFSGSWVEFGKRFAVNGERWVTELALARAMQGHGDDARKTLEQIAQLPQQNYGQSVLATMNHVADAAWIELAAGDADAAARELAKGADALRNTPQAFDAEFVHLATVAAEIALQRGDFVIAHEQASAALAHLRDKADAHSLPYLEARALKAYGDALIASGRSDEAVAQLEPAVATMRRIQSADSPWLLDALASLGVAQSRQGDTRQARALVEEASAIARRNKSFPKLYTARLDEAQQLIR
jgi:serine/threonine-protein kinase